MNTEQLLQCKICKEFKNENDFYRHNKTKNGRWNHCKMCEENKIKQRKINKKYITKQEKKCTKCKIVKKISEFHRNGRSIDGLMYYCKVCWIERGKTDRNKELQKQYVQRNKEKISAYHRNRHKKLRQEVIAAYGGKCSCCGESDYEFLTLEHKNGNGAEHRKEIGRAPYQMYQKVIKENFPDCYEILCWNCNCARGFFGYCPHNKSFDLCTYNIMGNKNA